MDYSITINHYEPVTELIKKYQCLSALSYANLNTKKIGHWNTSNNVEIHQLQVMFVGKTGYGKSTTLNRIVGKNVFVTNDISACTKELYEALYEIDKNKKSYFALCDLPGMGESVKTDKQYFEWYKKMLEESQCVVYVLRADQRDFSIDKMVFEQLFKNSNTKKRVIIALNYADKIEPINRDYGISEDQRRNLIKKVSTVSEIFKVPIEQILYYSAKEGVNVELLMERISRVLLH